LQARRRRGACAGAPRRSVARLLEVTARLERVALSGRLLCEEIPLMMNALKQH